MKLSEERVKWWVGRNAFALQVEKFFVNSSIHNLIEQNC